MATANVIARTTPVREVHEHETGGWTPLYRIGAWAAMLTLALIPVQLAVFVIWPLPESVTDWFALFHGNALVGLVDMDLLLIVDWVLIALILLALGVAVRRTGRSLLAIAAVFQTLATAAYFASMGAVEMLALSARYADATTDAQRSAIVAAGEAVLVTWQGTAFALSSVLSAIAMLLLAGVMLRSGVLGRLIPRLGIAMGITAIVPPNAGTVGLVFSLVYLVPFVVWLVLVARALPRFGDGETTAGTRTA